MVKWIFLSLGLILCGPVFSQVSKVGGSYRVASIKKASHDNVAVEFVALEGQTEVM